MLICGSAFLQLLLEMLLFQAPVAFVPYRMLVCTCEVQPGMQDSGAVPHAASLQTSSARPLSVKIIKIIILNVLKICQFSQ